MDGSSEFGRLLLVLGLTLAALGLLFMVGAKVPWLGRLPGDITIQRGSFTFYFPVVTCLVISLLLTVVFRLFRG